MINKHIVKCYEYTTPIKKDIFLSLLLRNGFVFAMNIYVFQFSNEKEMDILGSISNDQ